MLIVDDHAIFREGVSIILESTPEVKVVGEAETGEEALRQIARLRPDVVLMDISMPGMDGVEATRLIREQFPQTKVLALSMYENEQQAIKILNAGAIGFVAKKAAARELVSAIKMARQSQSYLHPTLATKIVSEHFWNGMGNRKRKESPGLLTEREEEILQFIYEGDTSREIAARLSISPRTVQVHRMNIMKKLGVNNTVDLIKRSLSLGLIGNTTNG